MSNYKVGRPPIFESPEEMQKKIEKYFKDGMTKKQIVTSKNGRNEVVEIPVPTITGLCNYLGFESRQSFYDYGKDPKFSYTVKRAKLFIEQEYEQVLMTTGNSGSIFALKNFDWKDKTEVEQNGTIKIVKETLDE